MINAFKVYAQEHGLYIATAKDISKLVDAAISGFGNSYPLQQWFDQGGDGSNLTEKAIHPKGWRATWEANILSMMPESVILADSPEINAWIMWTKPGAKPFSDMEWMKNGGYKALMHMGIPEMIRFDTYEKYSVAMRKKLAPESFYLYNLVVRKECQRLGLGKKLLQVSHDYMDSKGFSTYLETHNPKNVPYYQTLGYVSFPDGTIPNTRLTHYVMKRSR